MSLLTPDDFVEVQKYLAATATLSAPRIPLDENLNLGLGELSRAEQQLCDMMRYIIPKIKHNAATFRVETLEPMISLGARISNISEFQNRITMISDTIKSMRSHPVKSSEYQDERAGALAVLNDLREETNRPHRGCVEVASRLNFVSHFEGAQ
jgi:hypothetical protein